MKIILTETQLNKLISEQEYLDTNSRPVSFTEDDREMLTRIYDVVVRGGASGGYGGVRRRAIPALGTLPDTKAY
tara:strand:- start:310 stop:531 length:222 start_codon:yes stop_codon:yes gene_type:complete